jgi:hypothetical protein
MPLIDFSQKRILSMLLIDFRGTQGLFLPGRGITVDKQ